MNLSFNHKNLEEIWETHPGWDEIKHTKKGKKQISLDLRVCLEDGCLSEQEVELVKEFLGDV